MSVHKETNGKKWYVTCRYTDWQGETKKKCKRGFTTKREAQEWEREFLSQATADVEMAFASFVELYEQDMKPKLKLSTWISKESVIKKLILPYFKNKKLSEITPRDVLSWQNEIRSLNSVYGKPYSEDSLENIHAQLSSIFNHGIKYYGLKENPAAKAGKMGGENRKEMLFWTKDEYTKFAEEMMDKPISFYAFEMLYWCGIREGELLALTPSDFDFKAKTVRITKTYHRLHGKDIITTPKTRKSKRVVQMPDFLCEEMQEYIHMFYNIDNAARLFPVSKHYLTREMERGSKAAGVKKIRIHDLRHSHVSLLIDMGFTALAIADRVGHETVDITYRYAHLFPTAQTDMANRLNSLRSEA